MVKQRGFTIVELIMVIVIIGILAAVVGPRFFSKSNFDERFYFEETLSAVRYAQKLAVASGCLVKVTVNNYGYSLEYGSGACSGAVINDPSGKEYPIALPTNVVVQGGINSVFNSLGCIAGAPSAPCKTSNETATIGGFSLTVYGATGFIEVNP